MAGSGPADYTYAPVNQTPKADLLSSRVHEVHEGRPHRTLGWKLRTLLSRFWVWEALGCGVALVIAAIIGLLLKLLDGSKTENWTQSWSPTSALALAVTVAKAAMLIPVASAISQLKWHNYKEKTKLGHLESFDGATRGTLGSLKLLWELKGWHFACIGAAITVSTLSIDALSQNAVRVINVPRVTYGDNAVHRTRTYNMASSFSQRGRNYPSATMLPSFYYALSSMDAPDFQHDLAVCKSGNCTFGFYDSLAADFQCVPAKAERSGQLVYHGGVGNNNDTFSMDIARGVVLSNTTFQPPPAGLYKDLGPLIGRWLVLANPSTVHPAPQAMECAFYWTVKKYEGNVTNGVFYEKAVATYMNNVATNPKTGDISITPDECWRNNTQLSVKDNRNCTSVVVRGSQESMQTWFKTTDNSLIGWAANDTLRTDNQAVWAYTSIFMQSMLGRIANRNETQIAAAVNNTAAALSNAITSTLRKSPEYLLPSVEYGASYGEMQWPPTTIYVIHWKYLVFPAALVIASTFFLLGTIFATWNDGIWKASQLALIFHGLNERDSMTLGNVHDHATMADVADGLRVQLVETQLGQKLQVV